MPDRFLQVYFLMMNMMNNKPSGVKPGGIFLPCGSGKSLFAVCGRPPGRLKHFLTDLPGLSSSVPTENVL